jgi:hypothetical protein
MLISRAARARLGANRMIKKRCLSDANLDANSELRWSLEEVDCAFELVSRQSFRFEGSAAHSVWRNIRWDYRRSSLGSSDGTA